MNPIFSPVGEGWPKFPARSYGRLDQTEPPVLAGASEAVFAFDVVDADWARLGASELFDLDDANGIANRQQGFWKRMFHDPVGVRPEDPYETAPIFRIEITARRGDGVFEELDRFAEDEWVSIELADAGTFEVDVYGGLFAAPVTAYLQAVAAVPAQAPALSATFDMDAWPDAPAAGIASCLAALPDLEFLVVYDVGQGSANGFLDAGENVHVYFDLGCGVYGNRHTRPSPLRFCWRADPPVVLSHWDSDHWAAEALDHAAHSRTWLAPRQPIGPKHTAFASKVLKAGGNVLIWGAAPSRISVRSGSRDLHLARCTGPRSSRNGSGISCVIDDAQASEAWLLTGDAGYHQVNQPLPAYLNAVVAPHHGADMGPGSIPPARPGGHARVLYSFGPDNKHGRTKVRHPTSGGIAAHASQRWNHGAWTPGTPGTCIAGADVLATAEHPGNHLHGAAVTWSAPASVPFSTVPCAGSPPGKHGCTGQIVQA